MTSRKKKPHAVPVAASKPTVTVNPTRRTDAALHPASRLDVIVSRALDQELEWYFGYAESALRREDVGMLPSYAVVRILATEPTDEAIRAKGHELARTVKACLHGLPGRHASVLRVAYTPRRWPRNVVKAFDTLAPVAVRLALAEDPWPARSSRAGLEEAVAAQLSAGLVQKSGVPVGRLRAQAQRLFGSAVVAYMAARSLDASGVGLR